MDVTQNGLIDEKLGFSRLELADRVYWLIRLRWIFITGIFGAVLIAYLARADIQYKEIGICCLLLIALNTLYLFITRSIDYYPIKECYHQHFTLTNVQISLDFLLLTFLLHFSSGVENPFRLFYVLHTITASILLTPKVAFSQTSFGILCYICLAVLEYLNIIPHYPASPRFNLITIPWEHFVASLVVFSLTQYFACYMTMSIMKRLRRHAAELLRAYRKLEYMDKNKLEFIRGATHELKTPIAAVQSMAQTVLDVFASTIPPEAQKMINRIQQRSHETLIQISKMLEMQKRQLEEININKIAETDWRTILQEQIENHQDLSLRKNINFKVIARDNLSPLLTDHHILTQISSNLISNAIRYSKENGTIEIYLRERPGRLILGVKDHGIGISRSEQKKIFEDSYRSVNARKYDESGSGLGMTLVKKYVDRLGGTIRLRSEEDRGTTVTVSIPIIR